MADPKSTRRNRRPVALTVIVVVLCVLGAVCSQANTITSWYAAKHLRETYPWITGGTVEFKYPWKEVRLIGIDFDKGWARGHLDYVTVNRKTNEVFVVGGHVEADLDKRQTGQEGSSERKGLTVAGLTVNVKKGEYRAQAEGVSWGGQDVLFTKARVVTPWTTLSIEQGSYSPTLGAGVVVSATGNFDLPVKVPGLDLKTVQVIAKGVVFDQKDLRVRAASLSVGPLEGEPYLLADEVMVSRPTHPNHLAYVHVKAKSVGFQHPWLSPKMETFEGLEGSLYPTPEGQYDISLHAPIGVRVLPADQYVGVHGSCQDWADLVGRETILKGMGFSGHLHVGVGMKPIPHVKMNQSLFPADCAPTSCQAFHALRRPFKYTAVKSDGSFFERTSGPGTPFWVPLGGGGRMMMAVENLEDPGFQYHRGFIKQAYENSLIENVRTGKFTRGGSTLTMQLAKNLFLKREKTLLRKAQELLLAMAMEKCLSKAEIMELYLNIVEFGPDVYGIGPGAKHWFDKSPAELQPVEAFWMASILPKPRKASKPGPDALKGTERLMSALAKQGKIPDFVGGLEDVDISGWDSSP